MKKLSVLCTGIAALIVFAVAAPSFAAEKAAKERTITGDAKCAKCILKEGDKCQTVIQTENKQGKIVTYYLTANDVSKAFHENVCKEAKKVTATGTVKKVDGKNEFTASKIELVTAK
jgi:RecG-like helicase